MGVWERKAKAGAIGGVTGFVVGGAAAAFPLGAFYYVDETMAYGAIQRLNPEGASRAKRAVKPVHRINSSGKVCGLGFYTESGNDLASLAGKYIA